MKNEIMNFKFSEEQQEMRSTLIDGKPCFVANDACNILGIANSRDAIKSLDEDEKLTSVISTSGQNRKVNFVTESGLYALIFQSRKPQAKKFRKWITSEVIPQLRKTGKYQMNASKREDYIDLRHETYTFTEINKKPVRVLQYEGQEWLSLTDRNKAIGVTTGAVQQVKTLSASMALKIWVYGCTNPSWFVTRKALALLELGTRKAEPLNERQLNLFIS